MNRWSAENNPSMNVAQWLSERGPRGGHRQHQNPQHHERSIVDASYLPPEIARQIADGSLVVGEFDVLKWTMGIAFVRAPQWLPRDVAIQEGISGRGGALPGDLVAVELSHQSQWLPKSDARNEEQHEAHHQATLGVSARLQDGREIRRLLPQSNTAPVASPTIRLCRHLGARPPKWPPGLQPQGVVAAVLQRNFQRFLACRPQDAPVRVASNRFYKFKPYDEKYPIIAVYGRDIPQEFWTLLDQHLYLIELAFHDDSIEWIDGRFPVGRVRRSLGKAGTAEAESEAIARAYQCPSETFDEEAERCIETNFVVPCPEMLKRMDRRDLRSEEFVCTIDPATARDLDDALSCVRVHGGFRVGVHIADVSHFVPVGSALDVEAKRRATSTYFVERCIPMLPKKLSEDFCSLNPGEDKFAFSVLWNVDHSGRILSEWFGQSVIRSSCRLSYQDAQRIIEGDETADWLTFPGSYPSHREELAGKLVGTMKDLFFVASRLRDMRKDRGALWLSRAKMSFLFEDNDSRLSPQGFRVERLREANWVVEEFMLLANCRVAEKLVEFLPDCSLLRKHDRPEQKKILTFVQAAARHGYEIKSSSSKSLNESIHRYDDDPQIDLLRCMATYSMQLARYICSDEDEEAPISHFALAVPLYTHFTSPIRRYCDIIVHRQLLLALEIEALEKRHCEITCISQLRHACYYVSPAEVSLIAERCNERREAARDASSASLKLFFCLFLEALRQKAKVVRSVSQLQSCVVFASKVSNNKFQLFAPQLALECEVYYNSRAQRWNGIFNVDPKEMTFTIDWGTDPRTGESCVEKFGLFSESWASLHVIYRGNVGLDMILWPPYERLGAAPRVPNVL